MAESKTDSSRSPSPVRVGQVLGPATTAHLGRIVSRLIIGLLDEPMHLAVVAPSGADLAFSAAGGCGPKWHHIQPHAVTRQR